jgi:hypothetical protein
MDLDVDVGRWTSLGPGKEKEVFPWFSLALLLFFRGPDRAERAGEAQNGNLDLDLRSLSALALLFGCLLSLRPLNRRLTLHPDDQMATINHTGFGGQHPSSDSPCYCNGDTWPGCHFQLTFQSDWWHYFGQPSSLEASWCLGQSDNVWLNVMLSLIQLLVEVVDPWSTHGQIMPRDFLPDKYHEWSFIMIAPRLSLTHLTQITQMINLS